MFSKLNKNRSPPTMILVYIRTVSITQVGAWVLPKERSCPVAAMPNKVVWGGGNGLG